MYRVHLLLRAARRVPVRVVGRAVGGVVVVRCLFCERSPLYAGGDWPLGLPPIGSEGKSAVVKVPRRTLGQGSRAGLTAGSRLVSIASSAGGVGASRSSPILFCLQLSVPLRGVPPERSRAAWAVAAGQEA